MRSLTCYICLLAFESLDIFTCFVLSYNYCQDIYLTSWHAMAYRYSDCCCGQGSLGRTLHLWWRILQASHLILTPYWSQYKGNQPTLSHTMVKQLHLLYKRRILAIFVHRILKNRLEIWQHSFGFPCWVDLGDVWFNRKEWNEIRYLRVWVSNIWGGIKVWETHICNYFWYQRDL